MAPVEAIAAVLVGDPSPDTGKRLDRLGLHAPPEAMARARLAAHELRDRGRLTGAASDPGIVYEALLVDDAREAGAHYTPTDVARALVDAALAEFDDDPSTLRVWDPSCGGGVFLLAAAEHLVERGADPTRLLTEQLHGTDIDPGALIVTAAALHRWGRTHGVDVDPTLLGRADTLRRRPPASDDHDSGFDLIIGNPPFQSQLRGTNVRSAADRRVLRERFGDLLGPYTDTAALFLAVGTEELRAGGRLCLIQPLSVIANRDTEPIRAHLERTTRLHGLWIAGEPIFDAAVEVCAPILEKPAAASGRPGPRGAARTTDTPGRAPAAGVRRYRGRRVERIVGADASMPRGTDTTTATDPEAPVDDETETFAASRSAGRWGALALPALGTPDPRHRSAGHLGELVRAVAGFRDEYYGLVPHVLDADPADDLQDLGEAAWPDRLAPLVTVGLIDPARNRWGQRPVTFAKQRLERPVVDLEGLRADTDAAALKATRWIRSTAVPKVLVATQTRVGEAVADHRGNWVPSTPVIALLAPEPMLDLVVAVICSPIGSIAAIAATAGTGRTAPTIRLRTTTIGDLPLPVDHGAWETGARALTAGDRTGFLTAMAAAYAVPEPDAGAIAEWWSDAAPR